MTSTAAGGGGATDRRSRALLVFCAVAVAFAAVDTYVVVLVLPDMLATAKINPEELQRAAPIISGFLLGYVAVLPLIGRIADLRGPVPVLAASLVLFSLGSLVTAGAYDLTTMVSGRFLQGVGGGGLVPATMALVGALYPVERRGMPLGLVSAVQEFGAVLGPLFGALVLTFTTWQGIFAINVLVGVLLYVSIRTFGWHAVPDRAPRDRSGRGWLTLSALVGLVALVTGGLTFYQPPELVSDLTFGQLYVPWADSRWATPMGTTAAVAALLFLVLCAAAPRAVVDLRGWTRNALDADLVGALLLAAVLGGIVLAFATADPEVAVFSEQGPWFLAGSAVALAALVVHLRRAERPIVPTGALSARAAWGSLVVSFLVGWALIAALVDIPLFARTTVYDTQLGAALVLLRFLVALPVGAVVGGYLVRRLPAGVIAAVGMLLAAVAFAWMSTWDATSLEQVAVSTVPLLLGGFGFGLALAPVNAAVLATTAPSNHGIASAMVVVARMIGMLVGISVLTTVGLRRLYAERDVRTEPCTTTACIRQLGVLQEQTVFQAAAGFALLAAVLALVLLRGAPTRGVPTGELLRAAG